MARAKQIAGGVVLAVMTFVVVAGASYALWLGAPLLNPEVDHFTARDIPIINTDAKIVRPIPSADSSAHSGVVQPAPTESKPKARTVLHRSSAKRRSISTVARASSRSSVARAKVVAVADVRERDEGESERSGTESD